MDDVWKSGRRAVEKVQIGCGEAVRELWKSGSPPWKTGGRLRKPCGKAVENTPEAVDDLWTMTGNAL